MASFSPPPLPEIRRRPGAGPVLVVAPHPDDETMGLGGTIALHAEQGDRITALYVFSGIQGDPEGYFDRDGLVARRQEEARAAAAILGISELRFLGFPDNLSDADVHVFEGLPEDPEEARRALVHGLAGDLGKLLDVEPFATVYAPWEGELNADHWHIGQAVAHLRRARPDLETRVTFLGYDVWSPLVPETVLDTSDVIERKLAAVRCYRSQLVYVDYEHAVLGLDAYRSLLLERGATYGEAFAGRYRSPEPEPEPDPRRNDGP